MTSAPAPAPAPKQTTILFIPGAWHSPECFTKLLAPLAEAGYTTELVHLPSLNPSTPHTDFFAEDVTHIRTRIEAAASTGHQIILFVHSYGGIPGSEAVRGLDYRTRQATLKTQPGGVTHIFYCCSFLIPEGSSLISAIWGEDLPWFRISGDGEVVTPADPGAVFYNDMDEGDVRVAVEALRPHNYMTFHSVVGYAAWKYVPCTYLYCLRDSAIPIAAQRMMVEEVAVGVGIRTEVVDASHSPFYSVPGEVVGAVRRAAGELYLS
ncbi:alpha/beta-hydrolase [Aspergillus californicus]